MGIRFLGCYEPRADANGRRAGSEQLRKSFRRSDSSSGHNWDIDAHESLGENVVQMLHPAHVATGFDALSYYEVAAGLGRRASFGGGSGLPSDDRVATFRKSHEISIGVAVELNDLDRRRGSLNRFRYDERDQKADPDRLTGTCSRVL